MGRLHRALTLVVTIALGCADGLSTVDESTTTSAASTGGAAETTETSTGDVATQTTGTSTTSTSEPEDPSAFLVRPDMYEGFECDQWGQDCPPGTKCMPYSQHDYAGWNALACKPQDPDPAGPGEACTVEGGRYSGIDSCQEGNMCWYVDPRGLGKCVPFCVGSESAPHCTDPARRCSLSAVGLPNVCLPECDPLLQDCRDGHGCYPLDDAFICMPDVSLESGETGDQCELINACAPGQTCFSASALPGCETSGCCTSICDTRSGERCTQPGTTCAPLYDPEDAPPGRAHIGFCRLP